MMQISHLDIAIIVVYLLAVLGVGLYQALKIRTSGDYYAGGRKFNKFYLMMHALGTASHADEPVSVIGGAYEKGLSGIWYTYTVPSAHADLLAASRRTSAAGDLSRWRISFARDTTTASPCSIRSIGVLKMCVAIGVVLDGDRRRSSTRSPAHSIDPALGDPTR